MSKLVIKSGRVAGKTMHLDKRPTNAEIQGAIDYVALRAVNEQLRTALREARGIIEDLSDSLSVFADPDTSYLKEVRRARAWLAAHPDHPGLPETGGKDAKE